jgi:uncharacterized membrane protein YqhA
VVVVVAIAFTALVTMGWGVALAVDFLRNLLEGGWSSGAAIVDLLALIDVFLLAVVQVIVAVGLYELFVADIDVPAGLEVRTLSDLKNAIGELLVLVVAIKFLEKFVESKDALDVLFYAGAVALVGATLVAFTVLRSKKPA